MKTTAAVIFFFGSSFLSFAQLESTCTKSKISFGFNIGYNQSIVTYEKGPASEFQWIENKNDPGFRLGVTMEHEITKWLSAQPIAELAFNGSQIIRSPYTDLATISLIYPASLVFSTNLLFSSGATPQGIYLLIGPNINLPLPHEDLVGSAVYKSPNWGLNYGFGFDIKTSKFTMSPEIRLSHGLSNISVDPSMFGDMKLHSIAFVVNFKG